MINKLLFKISERLPCRLIRLDSGPYLERYYLGSLLGVTFYLHRFVSSDSERHIHNHPWGWGASLILAGSYIEERATDICPAVNASGCMTSMVVRRWFNRVDGNTFHRIHDAAPGTWSLFFHGPRTVVNVPSACGKLEYTRDKGWGFLSATCLPSVGRSVVFTPWPATNSSWWEDAPSGADVGRESLNS